MRTPQEIARLIPSNPPRWGIRGRWGPIEPATATAQRETPMSVGQLENALRVAATEIFVKERRVSRVIFIKREQGEQTVTTLLYSAAERGQIVRSQATPRALEGLLDVNLALLDKAENVTEEVATGESMDYPGLLARLEALPQLRSVPHERYF